MKITDALTLFYRSNPPAPASQGSGVKPVPVIDRMTLHPGQLFHGEVLGVDAKGHLLLKIGGEIIATRSLISMEVGQQAWVEVKEVGDSPIFALAEAKGAVHELLKNIMEVRPVVLAPGKGETVLPTDFQATPSVSSSPSFIPKLSPLHADGGVHRETMQLLRGFVAVSRMEVPVLSETKMQQLAPFLSPDKTQIDLGKVLTVLQETGRIPPVLGDLAPLRPLFYFGGGAEGRPPALGAGEVTPAALQSATEDNIPTSFTTRVPEVASSLRPGGGSATPVPFITGEGQVVGHALPVVRSLVEAVALAQGVNVEDLSSAELGKGFVDLSKVVLIDGKIPDYIRELEPMKQLLQPNQMLWAKGSAPLQATTALEFVQGFAETALPAKNLSPMQHNETVVKVLAGLQGAEPKPELLQILKQMVSSGVNPQGVSDEEAEKIALKQQDVSAGLAKAASFFDSHTVVNREVAQAGQGDCVLVPCFFAGQSGWGEWLWSHEEQEDKQGQSQEHLAFFLEMTNLGPVAIQVVLGENSIAGQFSVANETVYGLVTTALPTLEERLTALGYDAQFNCRKKSVAVMQDIKDSLETRTHGTSPTSLVDIQA